MSDVSSTNNTVQTATDYNSASYQKPDAFQDLDMNAFLDLMITELQNQDPMNPADNTQLLTQLGQIREIASNDKLTSTLDAMLMGENMASAAGMIGKYVNGMTEFGDDVAGIVDRATFENGDVRVHVGDQEVLMKNIREVVSIPEGVDANEIATQLSEASKLIGHIVTGVDTADNPVVGMADRASVQDGSVYVHIGNVSIPFGAIEEVRWPNDEELAALAEMAEDDSIEYVEGDSDAA